MDRPSSPEKDPDILEEKRRVWSWPYELCVGAMAGIQEADKKVRTIVDNIRALTLVARAAPELILLKSDVSKAHRKLKVTRRHWCYIIATVNKTFWVNMVGTYGVASAQLSCGRMAALRLPPPAGAALDLCLRGRLHGC